MDKTTVLRQLLRSSDSGPLCFDWILSPVSFSQPFLINDGRPLAVLGRVLGARFISCESPLTERSKLKGVGKKKMMGLKCVYAVRDLLLIHF